MSKQALEWLRAQGDAQAIPAAPWAVLKELAWKYDEKRGYAWPGVSRLAAETHLSRRTVQRALDDLASAADPDVPADRRRPSWVGAAPWIERELRDGTTTRYTLPRYGEASRQVRHGDAPSAGEASRDAASDVRHGDVPSGHYYAPGVPPGHPPVRHVDAQQVVETQGSTTTQGKPLRGNPAIDCRPGTPSALQLTFLADIYLMQSGHLVTADVRAEWAALTAADAGDDIRRGWASLEAERRQAVRDRIPAPHLAILSPEARRWLDRAQAAA